MSYIKNNFLLEDKNAEMLYLNYAKKMPIFDYHCHLNEYQILENKQFNDIYELWLKEDHYKWRLMRSHGVDEEYITGVKSPKEKFIEYCKTIETAFGNPLYHWSQLELLQFFNCNLEMNEKNAVKIWNYCNSYIKKNKLTPRKLIEKSNVKIIFTTNELFDDLNVFKKLSDLKLKFKVIPAFRCDRVINIEQDDYLSFINKGKKIDSLDTFKKVIEERLKEFIKVGCRASDISMIKVPLISNEEDAKKVFNKRLKKQKLTCEEVNIFKGYMMYFLFKLYAKYNIKSELHLGVTRNNNTKLLNKVGRDAGFDSISEENTTNNLMLFMDKLESENSLPPMILFNLNPKANVELIALMNSFQDSSLKGKIQYGPAWWFLDNKEGMIKHLKDLGSLSSIDSFIGMLTDSRSFLSYARHDYFRRILCNYLGRLMSENEITNDFAIVGKVVKNICYDNAIKYFSM